MNTTDKNQSTNNRISPAVDIVQRLWDAKVVIALIIMAIFFRASYFVNPDDDVPSKLVTASEIDYKTTKDAIGKTVTITSTPVQKVGLSSFTVRDKHFLKGQPIVVINASGEAFDLPSDQNSQIQVIGQVSKLVIPEVEQKFNLRLHDEYYNNYINQPAIIAKSITLAPDLDQISHNPSKYYGKKLGVMGKVQNVESPVLFTLDKNAVSTKKQLLVLLKATPTTAIAEGKTLALTGVVRPFVADDIMREYHFGWDSEVKKRMEASYNNKPVLIARSIYP